MNPSVDVHATQSQETFMELIPLTYSGPVPAPAPACTDATPDEQLSQATALRQEAHKQKEDDRTHHCAPDVAKKESLRDQITASAGEVYAHLKNAVSQAATSIEKGANDVSIRTAAQVRQMEYQHNCDTFRRVFPHLAQSGEVLLAVYACSAMHSGVQVKGYLYITRNHLCFYAESSSVVAKATQAVKDAFATARQAAVSAAEQNVSAQPQPRTYGIKQVIPLAEVACVLPSVALDTVGKLPPFFLPLPDQSVQATSLQVYVVSGKRLFQFLDFELSIVCSSEALFDVKGTALDRAFNYIDHAWRDVVDVPRKDVQYTS